MKKCLLIMMVLLIAMTSSIVFAVSFSDLTNEHWAYEPIIEMANKGILSGYPDGTFLPNKSITRAEFAKILVLSLDLKDETNKNSFFDDVDSSHWSYDYVRIASNYLSGYTNGSEIYFMPDEQAVREDMAVAIVMATNLQNKQYNLSTLDRFSDKDSISESFKKYVAIAVENNLMRGNADGTFNPKGKLTRAEVSQLMLNTTKELDKIAINETTYGEDVFKFHDMRDNGYIGASSANEEYNKNYNGYIDYTKSIVKNYEELSAIYDYPVELKKESNGKISVLRVLGISEKELQSLLKNANKNSEEENKATDKELISSGNTGKFVDMRDNGFVMVGSHSGYVDVTHKNSIVKSIKELFDIYDEKVEYSVYSDNSIVITKILKDGSEDDITKYEETDLTISVDKVNSPFEKTDSIKISFNRDLKNNEFYEASLSKKGSPDGINFIDYAKKTGKVITISGKDIFSAIEKNAFIGINKIDGASVTITIRVLYYTDDGYSRLLFEKPINLTLKEEIIQEEKKLVQESSGQFVDMRDNRYVMINTDSTSYSGYVDFEGKGSIVKNMNELFNIYDEIVNFSVYSDDSIVITGTSEKEVDLKVYVKNKKIDENSNNNVTMSINDTPIEVYTSSSVKKIYYKWIKSNERSNRGFTTQDGNNTETNHCTIVPELDLDCTDYTLEIYFINKNGDESAHYKYKLNVDIENTLYCSLYQGYYSNKIDTKGGSFKVDSQSIDVSDLKESMDIIAFQITGENNVYKNKLTKIKNSEIQNLEHIKKIEDGTIYMEKKDGTSGTNISLNSLYNKLDNENVFIFKCKFLSDTMVKSVESIKTIELIANELILLKPDDKIMQIEVNGKNSLLVFRAN